MEIRSSVAVVTGASSGIGRAVALALAGKGATVVLAARRRERLEELEREIAGKGGRALAAPCDVTDTEQILHLAGLVHEAFGRCDILVNNAGIPAGERFESLAYERIDEVVATNLLSVLHATRAFLPGMRERGRGHILNVASIAGRHAVPGSGLYSATKHAVVAFSVSENLALHGQGVLVTAVNPGFIKTETFTGRGPRLLQTTSEKVAEATCRAIEHNRAPEVFVPGWVRIGWMLPPGLYHRAAGRAFARYRR